MNHQSLYPHPLQCGLPLLPIKGRVYFPTPSVKLIWLFCECSGIDPVSILKPRPWEVWGFQSQSPAALRPHARKAEPASLRMRVHVERGMLHSHPSHITVSAEAPWSTRQSHELPWIFRSWSNYQLNPASQEWLQITLCGAETSNPLHPAQITELEANCCHCFKSLSFGMVCHITKGNQNSLKERTKLLANSIYKYLYREFFRLLFSNSNNCNNQHI